ncbi:MAG: hypothetical protein NC218_06915 [Acetobacter sp.]|nr:hypothetical protein [Acetobacter sp.]
MKKRKHRWLDFLAGINATQKLTRILRSTFYKNDVTLFETKHADLIVSIYAKRYYLSDEAILKVFDLPNAKEILMDYVCTYNRQLPVSAERKLFTLAEWKDVMIAYIQHQHISEQAELMLFNRPDAAKLALLYIQNGKVSFTPAAQIKMLQLRDNVKVLNAFAQKERLADEAELWMLSRPNAAELVEVYMKHHTLTDEAQTKMFSQLSTGNLLKLLELLKNNKSGLCEAAQLKMFELPQADLLVITYFSNAVLTEKAEVKLFELPNPEEIILLYINVHNESDVLLFELPNYVNLVNKYVENHKATRKLLEMIFSHPEADKMLPTVAKKQQLDDQHQKCLFEQANAAELLTFYIEHNELCAEAQLMLFKLPKKDAANLLEKYAVKYTFSPYVLQRLAVRSYFY